MTKKLNTEEAAQYLQKLGLPFTAGTLAVWRSLGRGPKWKKVASRVFYERSDLLEFGQGEMLDKKRKHSGQCLKKGGYAKTASSE